jgi:hypothetical protein
MRLSAFVTDLRHMHALVGEVMFEVHLGGEVMFEVHLGARTRNTSIGEGTSSEGFSK